MKKTSYELAPSL